MLRCRGRHWCESIHSVFRPSYRPASSFSASQFLGKLVARLEIDLAGLLVDHILREVPADQIGTVGQNLLEPRIARAAARGPLGHLPAGVRHHRAVVGVDPDPYPACCRAAGRARNRSSSRPPCARMRRSRRNSRAVPRPSCRFTSSGATSAPAAVRSAFSVSVSCESSANSSVVTGSLRRRSMRTCTMSLASNSKSSQEPR